jgi:hypothetical protein
MFVLAHWNKVRLSHAGFEGVEAFVMSAMSISDDSKYKRTNGAVIAQLYLGGFVIIPQGEHECNVQAVGLADLCGNLPAIVKSVVSGKQPLLFRDAESYYLNGGGKEKIRNNLSMFDFEKRKM